MLTNPNIPFFRQLWWKFNRLKNSLLCCLGFHKWLKQASIDSGEISWWCKRGFHEPKNPDIGELVNAK